MHFNSSKYSIIESGGMVQPVLVLNVSSTINIIVQVTITDISATKSEDNKTGDYKLETQSVTFKKGTNIASLNISIIDDKFLEDNEMFNLTIDSSSPPSNVIVGNTGNTTVTIINDDGKYVYWNNKVIK